MNIILVRRGSIAIVDGISTYILETSSALEKLGHQVYILCGACNNINRHFLKEFFFVENIPKIIDWGKVSYVPTIKKQAMIKKISEELNIDIVHFNGFIPYFMKPNKVTVMTHHGFPIFMTYGKQRFLHIAGYKILQYLTRKYDLAIAVSRKHLHELKEFVPRLARRYMVIPPGTDVQKIRGAVGKIDAERDNIILHVGTRQEKNLEVSILAFATACRSYGIKDAKLIVVGKPTERSLNVLRKLSPDIRNRIRFVSTLPRIQLLKLIAKSKVLLAPSIYETFHILSLEALALGTPIVASSEIPKEVLVDGITGFRIKDPFNYKTFGELLAKILKDGGLWGELHGNCLRRVEMFDSIRVARTLVKVYKEILWSR